MTNMLLPSDLLALWHSGMRPQESASVDTETSGLFADDGARVSTVSVAFEDCDGEWMDFLAGEGKQDRVTWSMEEIVPGVEVAIVSLAWPFDQGTAGKPEDHGQEGLWAEADNLPVEEWVALMDWLELVGQDVGLDYHHSKFDLEKFRVGLRNHPTVGRELSQYTNWDSQNVCDLIYPTMTDPKTGRFTNSLKPSCGVLFGMEVQDEAETVKKYLQKKKLPAGRWDLMPWDVIGSYADLDARLTTRLRIRQQYDIDNDRVCGWLHDEYADSDDHVSRVAPIYEMIDRRLKVTMVLYRMIERGLPYDEAGSREAAILCRERAAEIEPHLPFEPTGPNAKDYFFTSKVTSRGAEGLNMVPYSVTEKGAPQLTAEILGRMVADEIPYAGMWSEWNKASNAASMWYEGYADKMGTDGRLRCDFKQNGTVSTRFSVGRVNLQAIPQDYRMSEHKVLAGIPTPRDLIRNAVDAMPEWKMWDLDLAQAELRVGAMFAECELMIKMIKEDADLHTFTTQALFPDVSIDDALFKTKWRQVGKRGNFSLQFGSGWATFKAMVSKETGIILEEHEARRIVKDWNALYPEYGQAIQLHMKRVERRQGLHKFAWMQAVNGERRWFKPYEEAHKAFNQRVQANLAQFAIDWMLLTDDYLIRQGLDKQTPTGKAGLILTVHDSQQLLLPNDSEGEAMAAQCAQFGRDLWKDMFPDIPGDVEYH